MIQPNFRWFIAIILLLAFGIAYSLVLARMERRGFLEGFRWLAAAIGAAFTLGCIAIVNWPSATLGAGAFFISGLPMALGEMWRYMRAREREQEYVRQTETLAK